MKNYYYVYKSQNGYGLTGSLEPASTLLPEAPAEREIKQTLGSIIELLLEKNRKYGNAALDPIRIFSKANSLEQIKVRLDDKLSRIKSGQVDEDEDVIVDLIGYLTLYLIALRRAEEGDLG